MESLLPALVRVDAATGEVGAAHVLDRRADRSGEARGLLARGDGVVWVQWADGLTRYLPEPREQRHADIPVRKLSAGANGLWCLLGDGLGLVDEDAVAVEPCGPQLDMRTLDLAAAGGLLWTLAWTEIHEPLATLTAIDPATGETVAARPIDGSPRWLAADGDTVWANVWRQPSPREITSHVLELDARSGEVRQEVELLPAGAGGPIADGVMWTIDGDPANPAEYRRPTTVQALDLRTGAVRGETPLPGSLTWSVLGPAHVWGCLERHGRWPPLVVAVPRDGGAAVVFDLDAVDVRSCLPLPPPPIEARETEEAMRARIASAFFGGLVSRDPDTEAVIERQPYIRGVAFEEVRLEGAFPGTEIVVLFRSNERPGVLFGRRQRIWDDDGAVSDVIDFMDVNLMEDVEACGYGLPAAPVPDASGVVWF